MHNRAPHDGRYLELHRQLCEKLGRLADQIHLHSHAAIEELEQDRQLDRDRITVIPHGNYRPLFPDPGRLAPTEAEAGRGFLLFGRLGRYKGGMDLVRSFAALGDGTARLVIAGKQIDPVDLSGLPPAVRERITVHDRFLSEDELLAVFDAADFVVSPYLATLTSGTVLLAMSLARPVIVPRLPTLAELVIDGDNGLLFSPDDPEALRDAPAARGSDECGGVAGNGDPGLRDRPALRLAGDRPCALRAALPADRQAAGALRARFGRGLTGGRGAQDGECSQGGGPAATRAARPVAERPGGDSRGTARRRRAGDA